MENGQSKSIEKELKKDVKAILSIPVIATMLDVICQNTGMGFAAIARVTEDRWITCSSRDDVNFGLKPGDELKLETTICNEIRQSGKAVIIDNVAEDPDYHDHHTPAMYGLQSYISMPIFRKNGTFFGTLCAIDTKPNKLKNAEVTGMFTLFADLISFHLDAVEKLEKSEDDLVKEKGFNELLENKVKERTAQLEEKNRVLDKVNKEMQAFTHITNHDLQEPLRKIQIIASYISENEETNLSAKGRDYFSRLQHSAHRMQRLIADLLAYSRTGTGKQKFMMVNIADIIADVETDFKEELDDKNATLTNEGACTVNIIPAQIRQLLHNLLSNSIKYASPSRPLQIEVSAKIAMGSTINSTLLADDKQYCHIKVQDNGIGFEPQYSEKIFDLFQRLHGRSEHGGTGIGLGIVKRVVENHNGFISATGIPDSGAVFDVYLPMHKILHPENA